MHNQCQVGITGIQMKAASIKFMAGRWQPDLFSLEICIGLGASIARIKKHLQDDFATFMPDRPEPLVADIGH